MNQPNGATWARVLAMLAMTASCGSGGDAPDGGAPATGLDGGLADGTTDAPGSDVTFGSFGEGGAEADLATNGCAADLQTILDPHGNPIGKCPADQGCLNGGCVPACQAAAGSMSTIGCDYYAHEYALSLVDGWQSGWVRGGCYAAVVVNSWSTPARLTVTRSGAALPVDQFARVLGADSAGNLQYDPYPATGLPAGTAAVLFLSYDPRTAMTGVDAPCPVGVTPATTTDAALIGTGYNDAFEIATDRPVTAYQVYPWGGAASAFPSATLLYPSTAWGTNYVAPAINDAYEINFGSYGWTKPFITLVASDDTAVTLVAKADIAGNPDGGVAPAPKNTPVTYSIQKGQYLQLLQYPSLGGSIVSSTKPVGMFVGSMLFLLPATGDADNQGQMVPPIRAQGWEYIGASYELQAPTVWQLVGAVDGTALTYDPAPPAGAPATINLGDVVEFSSQTEFTVRSQGSGYPFYMAVYKRSDDAGPTVGRTDSGPDFVNLLPPVQYRSQYVFVTDPTYVTTTLVFTRAKGSGDVTLDCAGKVQGWTPIGSGAFEVARLVFGQAAAAGCKNGARRVTGTGPFGLLVWGWSFAASYGYPAGGNSAPVNSVVVPPVAQ